MRVKKPAELNLVLLQGTSTVANTSTHSTVMIPDRRESLAFPRPTLVWGLSLFYTWHVPIFYSRGEPQICGASSLRGRRAMVITIHASRRWEGGNRLSAIKEPPKQASIKRCARPAPQALYWRV